MVFLCNMLIYWKLIVSLWHATKGETRRVKRKHLIMSNLTKKTEKRQSRKIGIAGGFINQMMGNNISEPIVGEGATILMYSDRHAYEVIEVSEDLTECVIREMDHKFIGSGYGDERYTYSSNPKNSTLRLRWNPKKCTWQKIFKEVHFIKSMAAKMQKQYGWGWVDVLCEEKGIDKKDLYNKDHHYLLLIEGISKEYIAKYDVSVIFGIMEEYRDPSF